MSSLKPDTLAYKDLANRSPSGIIPVSFYSRIFFSSCLFLKWLSLAPDMIFYRKQQQRVIITAN